MSHYRIMKHTFLLEEETTRKNYAFSRQRESGGLNIKDKKNGV